MRPARRLSTLQPDELWGHRLRIVEELEPGGMSHIGRAKDVALGRELVLKISPLPRKRMPRGQLARFIEEAQITAQLEHPNVVPVHDIGQDPEGRIYFSMKLVRGQSLEQILEKRRAGDAATISEFGLRRLLDVFLQVCLAIEYAHARGVIHRDLKPANIMVGDFGEVLVMDWGIAKLTAAAGRDDAVATAELPPLATTSDGGGSGGSVPPPPRIGGSDITSLRAGRAALATQAGELIGTPAYMSPQQAKGLPADERSDLYALGVILYEILCDRLPFDDEDPRVILAKALNEAPKRPSEVNPNAPLALETLALRLLEKDPERRALPLSTIRAQILDYIEGIGRDYRPGSIWSNVLWTAGAVALFAFLVWYLTGQNIAAVFVLAPATVFNTVGWFLVVLALGTPLWAAWTALRLRGDHDRFAEPTADERLVSGYLAHRTLATTIAPIFQLVFIAEIVLLAIRRFQTRGQVSGDFVVRITSELRTQWAQALIVILLFLFAYLFFLSAEVRFARRIDRYHSLVERPRWEAVWPYFLIVLLLFTIATTHVLDWVLAGRGGIGAFFEQQVLTQPLDLIEIGKTLVFQGTFLTVLVLGALLVAFPLAEVLAALRLPFQPADEAAVRQRSQYFVRSVAIFRVFRVNWLYGGAVIGALTAMTVLSRPAAEPLVKQVLYILGPSLIGFVGYGVTRRRITQFLNHAPAVARLLESEVEASRRERARALVDRLSAAPWLRRLVQLVIPLACVAGYLVWSGSGIHQRSVQQLVIPVTMQGWLLILPYLLLIPVLLARDSIELHRLRRRLQRETAAGDVREGD